MKNIAIINIPTSPTTQLLYPIIIIINKKNIAHPEFNIVGFLLYFGLSGIFTGLCCNVSDIYNNKW